MFNNIFKTNTATDAFEQLYDYILKNGVEHQNTLAIYNTHIIIEDPSKRTIDTTWRRFRADYAEIEYQWYLSQDRNPKMVVDAGAKLWKTLVDENGLVMSNYGYWWNVNNQLNNVIKLLKENPKSRQASISLLDTKIKDLNKKDMICTWGLNFLIYNNKLHLSVMMRSNDLIYGFCNDQYCFTSLMQLVANELSIEVGQYSHFVNNLHIYEKHFNMKKK